MKRNNKRIALIFITSAIILVLMYVIVILLKYVIPASNEQEVKVVSNDSLNIVEDLLVPNEYSRPQTPLEHIRGVVVHYTANPGTDAKANRDYFNSLSETNQTRDKRIYASSHYVIGLDGTIIQCIPLNEISYASNERNEDTVSIECCHPDKGGKFTDQTYNSLVNLVAWLCESYDISKDDIIRHYDITGKMCPKYYVNHKKAWNKFKEDVWSEKKDL